MRITPAHLLPDPLPLELDIPAGVIDYAPDVRQTGTLHVKGAADRIEEHGGTREIVVDIRVRARCRGMFELLCARCLNPIGHHADLRFDLIFRPADADAVSGERAITVDETEIGYYEESGLLLEDVVREQVLLSLPGRTLCTPDCKGLCPSCGQNLNSASCNCEKAPADPRWNALAGLAGTIKLKN